MIKRTINNFWINGDSLVILAMFIFGSYTLFIRLLPQIPILSFLFSMQVIGAISFSLPAWRQEFKKIDKKIWLLLLGLALTATANDLTYFYSFRLTSAANATISHQLVSVFLLFLAPLFLLEKTRKNEFAAFFVALVGMIIIFSPGLALSRQDTLGIISGLLSALFYAFLIVIYIYMQKQNISVDIVNFWRYAFSAIILLPIISYTNGFSPLLRNFWYLIAFGLLFAVIAVRIHSLGIMQTRPLHVSIIGKSEPVIATFYAFIFLHQIPSLAAILGGILIIGSSLWLALQKETL